MLTERRKADREKMASILAEAMLAAGATAEVSPCSYAPRRIDVRISAPGGCRIHVDFDGDTSQPDVHVATWNTDDTVFMNPAVIGNLNTAHYGKANRVGYGLDDLIRQLEADLAHFISGDGYLSHDHPKLVAMAESYAARGWGDPRMPRKPWVREIAA